MNRDQKAAVIDEIAADITQAEAIFAVDYRGITVAQADALRARLRDADASFRVVKNSLTERAADKAGAEQLKTLLEGPTALTFVRGDAAAAAKAVADFARATQLLAFKGGLMDGATLSSADVGAISRLPAREVLYGQLVGLVASPIAGLARTLNALIGGLAVGLSGVLAQKEAAAPAATDEVAAAHGNAGEDGGSATDAGGPEDAATPEGAVDVADGAALEAAPAEAAAEAPVPQEEPDKETGDALAEPAEAVSAPQDAPVPQAEPDKDTGDALAEAAESVETTAAAADGDGEAVDADAAP